MMDLQGFIIVWGAGRILNEIWQKFGRNLAEIWQKFGRNLRFYEKN